MNEQVILTIAEAVLANTRILQTLVDALPREAQDRVERKVSEKTVKDIPAPAPAATVEIQTPAPAPVVVPAPVVAAPVVPPVPTPVAPVMVTPTPVVTAPVTPAVASPSSAPFSDQKGLVTYVMGKYKELGPIKGANIQSCLTAIGCNNINEVKAEHYAQLHSLIEAL